jgi:hypothetical protein
MELQQHQFEIKHRPGKSNSNTDALSRMYEKEESIENEVQVHSLRNGNQYLWNLGPAPGELEEEMEIYFAETTSEISKAKQPRPFFCCEEVQCNYEQDVYERFYQENQRQYHSDKWSDINKEEEYHGDWSNYGNHQKMKILFQVKFLIKKFKRISPPLFMENTLKKSMIITFGLIL